MQPIDIATYMTLGKYMFGFLAIVLPIMYLISNFREISQIIGCNSLLWVHPENNDQNIAMLKLAKIKSPQGPYYGYKSLFLIPEKPMKWYWEVKNTDKETGEVSYKLEVFLPDQHMNLQGTTAAELATAVDWEWSKPLFKGPTPMLEKLAQGGMIIMGAASLFGIMALLDMLNKG